MNGSLPGPVRAVTFDLGDTLWHFPDPPPREAIARHFATRIAHLLDAWQLTAAIPVEALEDRLRTARNQATRDADAGDLRSPDYVALTAEVARGAGVTLTRDQAGELWQAQNTGGDFLGRQLFEDTIETLEWLRGEGIRIAALTNRSHGGAMFLEELRQDGLLAYFDTVISSDQCGYRKPHPQIYRVTLDALRTAPHETLHVGDKPDVDVVGARQEGMLAVWMRRLAPADARPRHAEEEPHASIHVLRELRDLVHAAIA